MEQAVNIISFYLNESTDDLGRNIEYIWTMTDDSLMHTHDVIQLLFPTTEESSFNPDAPILTESDIILFHQNPKLRENLLASFHRFLKVFGVLYIDGIVTGDFDTWIFATPNHNWMRFTRIIKCLNTLGFKDEAKAFLKSLETNVKNPGDSLVFWQNAIKRL